MPDLHILVVITAPELLRSFQEQNKKAADALLEKSKAICGKHGVRIH